MVEFQLLSLVSIGCIWYREEHNLISLHSPSLAFPLPPYRQTVRMLLRRQVIAAQSLRAGLSTGTAAMATGVTSSVFQLSSQSRREQNAAPAASFSHPLMEHVLTKLQQLSLSSSATTADKEHEEILAFLREFAGKTVSYVVLCCIGLSRV